MFKRFAVATVVIGSLALLVAASAISAGSTPSGQRMYGNTSFDSTAGVFTGGGGTIEPAYDDSTGTLVYLQTPNNAHVNLNAPLDSNTGQPKNVAPIYLPVYPAGSGIDPASLNCAHQGGDNCPDHGPAVAFLAGLFEPGVYGGGVAGHDHLVGIASTGGDFNVLWVPTLVLFKSKADVVHITTLAQIQALGSKVDVIPLDGTGQASFVPNLTFHCSSVSAAAYWKATPSPTVVGP